MLNLISFMIGFLSRLEFPAPFSRILCSVFVAIFNINMDEAEKPLSEYKTIEDVFTRKLKPGARPIHGSFVSPSDGYLVRSEPAKSGVAVQAKALDYSLGELMHEEKQKDSLFHWYFTIYLAPPNYHRVHAPVTGNLIGFRYYPGTLWPVTSWVSHYLPNLYCKNERVIFDIEMNGGGRMSLAMVGAFNVGRIAIASAPDFVSNAAKRQLGRGVILSKTFDKPISIQAGDELGTFMLGSTVVVGLDKKAAESFRLVQTTTIKPILLGENLENKLEVTD